MVGREMLALYLLSAGLLWTPGWHVVEAGMKLGKVGQLPCMLEVPPDPSKTQDGESHLHWQHIQLVLSGSESQTLPHGSNSDTFLLQDKAGVLLPHVDEDVDKLECKVSRYFTANTQILWPGLPRRQVQLPTWYIVTITHTDDEFRISTFCFQPAEPSQGPGPAPFTGVFSLYTKASRVQVKLQGTVLLACGFTVDHVAKAMDVAWVLRQKGGRHREVLKYEGKRRQVTHLQEQAKAFPSEIPRGNASILLTSVAVRDQGTYFCSVGTAGLHWELGIEVVVVEPPKVTLSPQTPTLSLEEGEEKKLVCEVNRYFPLEAHVQWLREPEEGRMLPELVKNALFSNHRQSSDETYSFSSYFLLKVSLQDDGVRYTCRVEHESLHFPIRKSITIRVKERFEIKWWFLLLIIAILVVLLVLLLRTLHQVESRNKRKPY
ncbi:tapasin-related protein-like isoform X2 [Dromiciops gliroides]|uniref:tapasin-related protein-like isoform X2 n=1 Tax=Dromiciops gliroides TaxID=33562 RepID=UPI001CC6BDDB|nr:tapasin-related protein-like isoform X2 [Dromiciops gliroides]